MCTSVPEQQAYGVVPPASVASDEARRKLQEVKPFTEREGRRLERDNLRLTRAELDY